MDYLPSILWKRNFLRRQAAVIIANHIGNETFNHRCWWWISEFHFLNEVDLVTIVPSMLI